MQAVIESGLTDAEELIQINHYCCHQQVLFVSDVLDVSGKAIDKRYLERWEDHINWSTLIFPIENPLKRNLIVWWQVSYSLAPRSRCGASLGGTLDYIPNPTLRLIKRRVFTYGALIAS
jgi:hypothetical protein